MGELVGRADHEAVEGVVVGAGEQGVLLGLTAGLGLLLRQDLHLQVGGEQVLERLLDHTQIAQADDIGISLAGGAQDEPVLLQGDGGHVLEPGVHGDGIHVPFHQLKDLGPDVGGWICHVKKPPISVSDGESAAGNGGRRNTEKGPPSHRWKKGGPF